jgi:hypothetical protein
MRFVFIALMLCGAASVACAETPPAALRACAAEADSTRRLACYDKEMARLTPSVPAHDPAPGAVSSALDPRPADEFGLDEQRVRKLKTKQGTVELKALTAQITNLSQLPNGRQRITLDNAQVWEQTEEEWGFNPHSGASATITQGIFGGFWMATDAYRKVRVKRIR